MISLEESKKIALSLPESSEEPHFERTSFRVRKKIFATLDTPNRQVNLKLSIIDQDVFSSTSNGAIYPVANKWGKKGWTTIELDKVHPDLLKDALITAYCEVAPKTLSQQLRP